VIGQVPYGARLADAASGTVLIDDPEVAVVRMMYRWLVDEQHSLAAIAQELTERTWASITRAPSTGSGRAERPPESARVAAPSTTAHERPAVLARAMTSVPVLGRESLRHRHTLNPRSRSGRSWNSVEWGPKGCMSVRPLV